MKLMFVIVFSFIVQFIFAFETNKASNVKFLSSKSSKALNNNLSSEKITNNVEIKDKSNTNSKLKSEIHINKKDTLIQHQKSPKRLSEEEVILNLFVAI
jgi:hypothetical protein